MTELGEQKKDGAEIYQLGPQFMAEEEKRNTVVIPVCGLREGM